MQSYVVRFFPSVSGFSTEILFGRFFAFNHQLQNPKRPMGLVILYCSLTARSSLQELATISKKLMNFRNLIKDKDKERLLSEEQKRYLGQKRFPVGWCLTLRMVGK